MPIGLSISCSVPPANSEPIIKGGLTLKYEGKTNSKYEDEIVSGDNDGPYIFYKGDSLKIVRISAKDYTSISSFDFIHKKDKELVSID
jgi:hypothetical protein